MTPAYLIGSRQADYGCPRCGGRRGDPSWTGRPEDNPDPNVRGSGTIPCPDCDGTGESSARVAARQAKEAAEKAEQGRRAREQRELEEAAARDRVRRREAEMEAKNRELHSRLKTTPTGELRFKTREGSEANATLESLRRVQWLMNKARTQTSDEETRYLWNQAEVAMRGGRLDVVVPPPEQTPVETRNALAFAQTTPEIAALARGIWRIHVPPPMPPTEVVVKFGELGPSETAEKWADGLVEVGLMGGPLVLKFGEGPPLVAHLIMKSVIADLNAADLYIVRQDELFEKSLHFLADKKTCEEFSRVVQALRQKKPVPTDASQDILQAAQAIIDPKLQNGSVRLAFSAMMSKSALNAAATQALIELGGYAAAKGGGSLTTRLQQLHDPSFQEAKGFLDKAEKILAVTTDPRAQESLRIAIEQANEMIAKSYELVSHGGDLLGEGAAAILKHREEAMESICSLLHRRELRVALS
jgi:hypothetical protein